MVKHELYIYFVNKKKETERGNILDKGLRDITQKEMTEGKKDGK